VRIAITGSSGLIGTALARSLEADGHEVVRVVRGEPGPGEVRWDPAAGTIDAAGLEGLDGAVHLAGEPVAARRWTDEQKRRILESRTTGTSLLATTLAGLGSPPPVLVSASGMDYYGDRGDEVLDESAGKGEGFLADVVEAWEGATAPGRGGRDPGGAPAHQHRARRLRRRAGQDAPAVQGRRRRPIGVRPAVVELDQHRRRGRRHPLPAGPRRVRPGEPGRARAGHQRHLTKVLGRVLGRPTVLPVPRFGPKLLLGGELAENLLFTSKRLRPAKLEAAGYHFTHPDLESALRAALGR
jgi:uncharacterized protein